jgi:hypothetical protein
MVLSAIDVVLVSKDTDSHARAGYLGQLYGSAETLITLRIVATFILANDPQYKCDSSVESRPLVF